MGPAVRGRGVVPWAPGAMLTHDDDHEASARTIERNGGVLEDVRETCAHGRKRRYWIAL